MRALICRNHRSPALRTHTHTPARLRLLYEDVWLRSSDGVKLHAWFIKLLPDWRGFKLRVMAVANAVVPIVIGGGGAFSLQIWWIFFMKESSLWSYGLETSAAVALLAAQVIVNVASSCIVPDEIPILQLLIGLLPLFALLYPGCYWNMLSIRKVAAAS